MALIGLFVGSVLYVEDWPGGTGVIHRFWRWNSDVPPTKAAGDFMLREPLRVAIDSRLDRGGDIRIGDRVCI